MARAAEARGPACKAGTDEQIILVVKLILIQHRHLDYAARRKVKLRKVCNKLSMHKTTACSTVGNFPFFQQPFLDFRLAYALFKYFCVKYHFLAINWKPNMEISLN